MTTPDPNNPDPTEKTFTQADVDRMIADRLKRAKPEPPADYAELQEKATKLAALEAAQLTEQEKQQRQAQEAEQKATAAEARARAAEERAAAALRRSEVISAATRAGAVDPAAVFALIDPSAVTVGDDGQVTGAEEAVKALLDEKKYLVGQPPTPTPGGADGGHRPSPTAPDIDSMSMEQYIAARKSGQIV